MFQLLNTYKSQSNSLNNPSLEVQENQDYNLYFLCISSKQIFIVLQQLLLEEQSGKKSIQSRNRSIQLKTNKLIGIQHRDELWQRLLSEVLKAFLFYRIHEIVSVRGIKEICSGECRQVQQLLSPYCLDIMNKLYIIIKMYGFKVGSEIQTQIYLNIYDLNPGFNQTCYKLGLGFFHTGIQISSTQYTFGYHEGSQTGVMEVTPKVNHPDFRESILLGTTSVPPHKIKSIIGQLKGKFPGNSYHIIRKNCNTFTNCVCQALLHKNIPYFVNRLANVTKSFMQIGDFIMMKPYDLKYEVSAKQFGIQAERSVFEKGQGVTIG